MRWPGEGEENRVMVIYDKKNLCMSGSGLRGISIKCDSLLEKYLVVQGWKDVVKECCPRLIIYIISDFIVTQFDIIHDFIVVSISY